MACPSPAAASPFPHQISPSTIEDSSSFPSTSTAQSSSCCYDVFLNHRGPDTKNTFASHLYHRLSCHGLRVFFDKLEMQAGDQLTDQLEGAIRSASVHIAIFSPRYAESKYCLNELLLMLKSEATIIPIFYHVKPQDLRWAGKGGAYAEALLNHKEKKTNDPQTGEEKPRYDLETIQNWIKALHRVADISGLTLEDCNGDEGELVNKVVERVQRKVRRTPLHVATYPTGLREKIEDLDKLPQQSGRAQVVGIVGLGGIGKTTLAKGFFNSRRAYYQASCFLFDVRQAAGNGTLRSLQMQLLSDLIQSRAPLIRSIDEGIGVLQRYLSSTQALIILDDVDHARQLEALFLPVKDVLRRGSLIVVTSRNKDLLRLSGIAESSIYKVTGLDRRHSQELFCSHAFDHPYPFVEFEEVVAKFLHACDGLPLSLKVIGALLRGKEDLEYWKTQFNKISKVLPFDIQSKLKISYDSLDEEEKNIFLDIACFFVGEDRETVQRIWQGSLGISSLENKCLVEVDSRNRIRMHDQLRDLGRFLAEKEPPECLRRLWRPVDNLTLQNLPDHLLVRGLCMVQRNSESSSPELRNRSVVDMSRLQLLRAEGNCLQSIFTGLGYSPELISLCWYNCPYSFLPSWLPIKNLRVLQVTGGKPLQTFWQTESQAPLELRELNVSVPLSKLPDSIGQLKHLEKIVLKEGSMIFLPNSFNSLTNLQYLDLSWSSGLRELPHSFGNLIRLKHLCLAGCSELSISHGTLGDITTLVSLDLSFCEKMNVLPSQVARQRFLKELNLLGTSLKVLPRDIGKLGRLETLKLGSPFMKLLPPSIGDLRSLKELTFSKCSILKCLPESVGELTSLKELSLSECESLECFPESVGKLARLKELTLYMCSELECLPQSVGELKQLTKLEIKSSGIKYLPIGITEMNNLEYLKVSWAFDLKYASFAKEIVTGTQIPKCLVGLKYLELDATRISELSFVEGICPNLQHLKIQACNNLLAVGALPSSLITLEIVFCWALREIGGLVGLAKLRVLDINGTAIKELPSLETLTSLEEFRAFACDKLKSIRGLARLVKLRLLDVKECAEIKELAGIEYLRSLNEFYYSDCPKLQGVGLLQELRAQLKIPRSKWGPREKPHIYMLDLC